MNQFSHLPKDDEWPSTWAIFLAWTCMGLACWAIIIGIVALVWWAV